MGEKTQDTIYGNGRRWEGRRDGTRDWKSRAQNTLLCGTSQSTRPEEREPEYNSGEMNEETGITSPINRQNRKGTAGNNPKWRIESADKGRIVPDARLNTVQWRVTGRERQARAKWESAYVRAPHKSDGNTRRNRTQTLSEERTQDTISGN